VVFPHCPAMIYAQVDMGDMVWAVPHKQRPVMAGFRAMEAYLLAVPLAGHRLIRRTTQLAPQFQDVLNKPIDTTGLAGMPGGPSTTQDLQNTQDALYQKQMQYLAPEQKLASEQMDSKLAKHGRDLWFTGLE